MFYYDKKEPNVGDIVFVTIEKVENVGTYCKLIEYGEMDGLILSTELDKWTRNDSIPLKISNPKKFNYNSTYCAVVLAVNKKVLLTRENFDDEEKEVEEIKIDLSYKRIDIEKREILIKQFEYITSIKKLCDEFSFVSGLSKEILYPLTLWKFTKEPNFVAKNKYYEFLKKSETICEFTQFEYPEKSEQFIINIKSRITCTSLIVEKYFELLVFENDGINKLKNILNLEESDVRVECVSSPTYKLVAEGYSFEECNQKLIDVFNTIKERSQNIISLVSEKSSPTDNNGIVKNQEFHIRPINMKPEQKKLNDDSI